MKWEPGKGDSASHYYSSGPFIICKAIGKGGPVYTLSHRGVLILSRPGQEGKNELMAMARNYRSSEQSQTT